METLRLLILSLVLAWCAIALRCDACEQSQPRRSLAERAHLRVCKTFRRTLRALLPSEHTVVAWIACCTVYIVFCIEAALGALRDSSILGDPERAAVMLVAALAAACHLIVCTWILKLTLALALTPPQRWGFWTLCQRVWIVAAASIVGAVLVIAATDWGCAVCIRRSWLAVATEIPAALVAAPRVLLLALDGHGCPAWSGAALFVAAIVPAAWCAAMCGCAIIAAAEWSSSRVHSLCLRRGWHKDAWLIAHYSGLLGCVIAISMVIGG